MKLALIISSVVAIIFGIFFGAKGDYSQGTYFWVLSFFCLWQAKAFYDF
jgi:hypothetical protein